MLELAKRQMFSTKVPVGCNFDLLTGNGVRIEVKSRTPVFLGRTEQFPFVLARQYYKHTGGGRVEYAGWSPKKMYSDFIVLVAFEKDIEKPPRAFFVLPQSSFAGRAGLTVRFDRLGVMERFQDNWDQIIGEREVPQIR